MQLYAVIPINLIIPNTYLSILLLENIAHKIYQDILIGTHKSSACACRHVYAQSLDSIAGKSEIGESERKRNKTCTIKILHSIPYIHNIHVFRLYPLHRSNINNIFLFHSYRFKYIFIRMYK